MREIKNILGVMVLYKTHYLDSVTFQSIVNAMHGYEEVLDLVVYDNSPLHANCEPEFQHGNITVHYKHDPKNSGVSAAYNYGAHYASTLPSKNWLLLLDQDTSFDKDLIKKFLQAMHANPEIKLFAPILRLKSGILFSPCKFIFKRGFPLKEINPGIISLQNISPVNSGMMINLPSFFEAGMYNEQVKLDFSDFQFIERFKKLESKFYVVDSVGIQDFSNDETDINKLNIRYAYFCEGAKKFEKFTFADHVQFLIVAFMRAVTLSYRNKSWIFFKTFVNSYLK